MKNLLAFLVLISHMNFSMFLPQMAEVDIYDANGMQQDDINSLIEYVDQVVLGNHDDTPEDEDDDSGQNFSLAKTVDYLYQQNFFVIEQHFTPILPRIFSDYTANHIRS